MKMGIYMLPYIEVFGHKVSMYVIMCLSGIGLAILSGSSRSRITGVPREDVFHSYLLGVIGLLVGGKIMYIASLFPLILKNMRNIIKNPEMLLVFGTGGFVFYGGIIGGIAVVIIYCKKYKINTLAMLDTIAPSIPLAHAFGRLGCLSAGCCYGCEYHGPFSLFFPEGGAAPHGIGLFPSQPAEAAVNFVLFIVLTLIGRQKRKDGILLGIYVILYAVARFILEFFRGDAGRGIFFGLSFSQWLSILIIPVGFYLIVRPHLVKNRDKIDIKP
jgi:phosphatidylglycerol:prolipoprotein diacylglycerol transferase